MSRTAVLLHGRSIEVSDGVYQERKDKPEPLLEELLRSWMARLPGLKSRKKRIRKLIEQTNAFEPEIQQLNSDDLIKNLASNADLMRHQGFSDDLLSRSFAIIREASLRTQGLRHHDVQLIGGWALLQGTIAEMQTGEGKTLVATLAACTAASAGVSVHVITVNDYLSERDANYNRKLYEFFNLSVGIIQQGMSPAERKKQYGCNIVYVSNKEIVFDYLKDRIATSNATSAHYRLRHLYRPHQTPQVLLQGLHIAIVDEADSVFVDEARTPLIISESVPDENGEELYGTALDIASSLENGKHFEISNDRSIWVKPEGEIFAKELCSDLTGVWQSSLWRNELLEKALSAIWCFQRDQHYLVADNKIQIIDEFTGRLMPDRSWEHGLHQMIEFKEGCEITGQRKTLSRITYQQFFRRYLLLCGMTGTASEIIPELRRIYDLEVIKIPTHQPSRRKHIGSQIWLTSEQRWQAVAERAAELSIAGRAVLLGTRSVDASESLSRFLTKQNVEHTVLNARQDQEEASVIAQAGQPGHITVATNMAGRGTDISLSNELADNLGLHVILTEFHESPRIDRQLIGRCARQGQPGSFEACVSLEDDIFKDHAKALLHFTNTIPFFKSTIPQWYLALMVRYAQTKAERHNAKMRIATLKNDRKLQRLLAFSGSSI
ncbi:MAG: preprotein translocase subunit SecA [Gammaproteobacteria bacterium]|nr:preprotein translocase subunit SecA [Gammaproteobacteria bacterium]